MSGILHFCAVLEAVHRIAPGRRFSLWIDGEKRNEGVIFDLDTLTASAEDLHDRGRSLMARFEDHGRVSSLGLPADGALWTDYFVPAEGAISHCGGSVPRDELPEQTALSLLRRPR